MAYRERGGGRFVVVSMTISGNWKGMNGAVQADTMDWSVQVYCLQSLWRTWPAVREIGGRMAREKVSSVSIRVLWEGVGVVSRQPGC